MDTGQKVAIALMVGYITALTISEDFRNAANCALLGSNNACEAVYGIRPFKENAPIVIDPDAPFTPLETRPLNEYEE